MKNLLLSVLFLGINILHAADFTDNQNPLDYSFFDSYTLLDCSDFSFDDAGGNFSSQNIFNDSGSSDQDFPNMFSSSLPNFDLDEFDFQLNTNENSNFIQDVSCDPLSDIFASGDMNDDLKKFLEKCEKQKPKLKKYETQKKTPENTVIRQSLYKQLNSKEIAEFKRKQELKNRERKSRKNNTQPKRLEKVQKIAEFKRQREFKKQARLLKKAEELKRLPIVADLQCVNGVYCLPTETKSSLAEKNKDTESSTPLPSIDEIFKHYKASNK